MPISTHRRPPPPPSDGEDETTPTVATKLSEWFSTFTSLQAETISTCISALSFGINDTYKAVEPNMLNATGDGGAGVLLRKIGVGLLAAAYVGIMLTALLLLAAVLSVAVVRMSVEEPVVMREKLNFDYTEAQPKSVLSFAPGNEGGGRGGLRGYNRNFLAKSKKLGVPVGHTFYVSLVLLMPESDYNRDIGIFQVTAELISKSGSVMTRSSHPCMLQFSSKPIRLMRQLIWGLPLLLGITAETQRIVIPMIRHKEGHPRTEAIRVILMARAGKPAAVPQVYEAEIVLKSHLPWMKELLYRWKWTLYVWATLYIYMALLVISLCFFRPLIVPVLSSNNVVSSDDDLLMLEGTGEGRGREGRNASESLKRRRLNRSRRQAAMLRQKVAAEQSEPLLESSASSYTITREDTAPLREDTEDSESVCFRSGGDE